MVDKSEVDFMTNLMNNLNNVESKTVQAKTNPTDNATHLSEDANAMHDILSKLQTVTNDVVVENANDTDLTMAITTQKADDSVSISNYKIALNKRKLQEGFTKTFYTIIDTNTNQVVYKDLGLFESAMGIVKHTLFTKKSSRVENILSLDESYVALISELYAYKKKMKRLDESTAQYDVAAAKYSNSKTKLEQVKMKLLKTL